MPALAIPLLIPFAEAAGIAIGTLTTAAGLDILSDKVEDYIEDNPENAQKIFAMIMPEQGLASIFNKEADSGDEDIEYDDFGEEITKTKEEPKLTGKEKSEKIKAAIRRARGEKGLPARGNYSSPDAEGSAVDIGGSVIREVEDMGIADKDLKDNYTGPSAYTGWKKFANKYKKKYADGGMMEYANGGGVGSMMQTKKKVPQLVTPNKDGSRPGYRGPGGYQGGSSSSSSSSKGGSTSSGSTSGGGNLGGGGGGQNSPSRRYSAPTRPTYTSKNIDSKPVTGSDYSNSRNNFINNLNNNNQIASQRNFTRFTPYQGGARNSPYYKSNPLSGLLKLAAGFAFPGGNFFLNKGGKFKEGIMKINDSIQNSDFGRSKNLMDYFDMKKFGGYDEREMAGQINKDEAKNLQARIDDGEFGGFERPTQNFTFDNSRMQPPAEVKGLSMMEQYYNDIDNKATGPNIVPDASTLAQQAKVFGLQDLQGIGALKEGKVFGYNTTDQGDALEKFRNSAVNFYNSPNNTNKTPQSAYDFMMNTNPNMFKDVKENKDYIQNTINQGFLENQTDYKNQKSLEDFT